MSMRGFIKDTKPDIFEQTMHLISKDPYNNYDIIKRVKKVNKGLKGLNGIIKEQID